MKIAVTGEDYVHSCRVLNTGNEAGSQLLMLMWIWSLTSKISYEKLLLPIFTWRQKGRRKINSLESTHSIQVALSSSTSTPIYQYINAV